MQHAHPVSKYDIAAWFMAAAALFLVLRLGLLAALLSGLLVYELVHAIAGQHGRIGVAHKTSKAVAFALLVAVTISLLSLGIVGLISMFAGQSDNVVALLRKMAGGVGTLQDAHANHRRLAIQACVASANETTHPV